MIEHMSEGLVDRVAGGVEDLTASGLLASIRSAREVENQAAAEQLVLGQRGHRHVRMSIA